MDERGSLAVGRRDNVNDEPHEKSREGDINNGDANEPPETEPHEEFDNRLQEKGKNRSDRNGNENRLQKGNPAHYDGADKNRNRSDRQERKRSDGRPEEFQLEWSGVVQIHTVCNGTDRGGQRKSNKATRF